MPNALRSDESRRRATNVSLDRGCLNEARELGINVSQACEKGLREAVAEARAAQWLEENREALLAWNEYVEKNGLPLEDLRMF